MVQGQEYRMDHTSDRLTMTYFRGNTHWLKYMFRALNSVEPQLPKQKKLKNDEINPGTNSDLSVK